MINPDLWLSSDAGQNRPQMLQRVTSQWREDMGTQQISVLRSIFMEYFIKVTHYDESFNVLLKIIQFYNVIGL